MGFWASDKHLPQNYFTGNFFRLRHFALPSMSLVYLLLSALSKNGKRQRGFKIKLESMLANLVDDGANNFTPDNLSGLCRICMILRLADP
jgi:hypothetical protein